MHFEQLDVPEKLYGIPSQVQAQLAGQLQQTEKELAKLQDTIAELLQKQGEKLYAATRKLESQSRNFDVRRLAACTKEDNREVFLYPVRLDVCHRCHSFSERNRG